MNRRFARTHAATIAFALAIWGQAASGQSFSSGSTGADGALSITTFNNNLTVRPGGVYNYTTVTITGTVRYFRNTDNAPLVILATGDVTIDTNALVDAGGNEGLNPNATFTGPLVGATGGPGGFAGGNGGFSGGLVPAAAVPPTAGSGPGGGAPATGNGGQGGTYGAPTSFATLMPLFGGSGGGGGSAVAPFAATTGGPGGGGGGAILIASSTRITIRGQIRANGGRTHPNNSVGCDGHGAAGTGGAIRLVAPVIVGGGNLQAIRGISASACAGATPAGDGRIRLEAFDVSGFTGTANPIPSIANAPGPASPAGNPALANVPTLTIASVGGIAVPALPQASYFSPDMALAPGTANPVPVVVNATNTPVGSPTAITVRVIPQSPGTLTNVAVPAADHTGSFASSSATANVTLPAGRVTVLQAHAAMTLTGQTASLFPLIDGEPVERVMVAATPGQPSTLSLVTKSGKERLVSEMPAEEQVRVAQAWATLAR